MYYVSSINYYRDLLNSATFGPLLTKFEAVSLERLLSRIDVNDSYITPSHAFKTGICLSTQRMLKIVKENSELFKKIDLIFSVLLYKKITKNSDHEKVAHLIAGYICFDAEFLLDKRLQCDSELNEFYSRVRGWQSETNEKSRACLTVKKESDVPNFGRLLRKVSAYSQYVGEFPKSRDKITNQVYFLHKARSFRGYVFFSSNPVAVMKGSEVDSPSLIKRLQTSVLELLSYQVADTLSLNKYFAKTECIQLETKENGYLGSFQPFLKGEFLEDAIKDGTIEEISSKDYIVANMATLLFLMSDAHGKNVILEKRTYSPIFFDNSRNMMHSPHLVRRPDGKLRVSYRNMLLETPRAFVSLSEEDRKWIKDFLGRYNDKKSKVAELLSQYCKEWELPLLVLNPSSTITAMNYVFDSLSTHYKTSKTLIDLVFAVLPIYKYVSTLSLALAYAQRGEKLISVSERDKEITPQKMSQLYTYCSECFNVQTKLRYCVSSHLSVTKLFSISKSTTAWPEWVKAVFDYVDEVRNSDDKEDTSKLSEEELLVLKELEGFALSDFKDPVDKK